MRLTTPRSVAALHDANRDMQRRDGTRRGQTGSFTPDSMYPPADFGVRIRLHPPPPSSGAFFFVAAACKTVLMHLSRRRGSGTTHPTPHMIITIIFLGTGVGRKSRLTALQNGQAVPSTPPHLLPAECRKVRPWKEVGRRRMSARAPGEWLKPSTPHTPLSPRIKSN